MSSSKRHFYDFEGFRLDQTEKVLLRDGTRVTLTPKVFDTLEIFVENSGRLIEKNELIERLWPGSFVEESNLTSNIKVLRKALGDDASEPRFIETVPRRGYRFVADVRTVAENGNTNGTVSAAVTEKPHLRPTVINVKRIVTFGVIFLAAAIIAFGFWISRAPSNATAAPILNSKFASEPFSRSGEVLFSVITQDGKNVIYTSGREGQQSIWMRTLENGNNVEIVPAADDRYFGLGVSPDGKTIYFVRRPRSIEKKALYRVSATGGIPTKIIDDTEGWISLSPDGEKISFVRCLYSEADYCSLLVADAESGKNEKRLASRERPMRIGDNDFSPDGRVIAFAVGQSQNQANEFGLMEIDIESGVERALTEDKFFDIRSLAWLPGNGGLLVTASKIPNKHFRIWEVDRTSGTTRSLTNDSESYHELSLPATGEVLISTIVRQDFQLYEFPADAAAARTSLADASHVSYGENGKIYFSSPMSGNDEIWSAARDGSGKRQLTNDTADDGSPTLSPKGDAVFFSSNRSGSSHVWRMNADGSDAKQITEANGGRPVAVTPDGNWVFYRHGIERNLWRVGANGGGEEMIFAKTPDEFAVSTDGKFVAYFERLGEQKLLQITSLENSQTLETYFIADKTQPFNRLAWMPDGSGVVYVLSPDGADQTLWFRPRESGLPQKIADLGAARVNSLAVSPDGKSFAIVQGGWAHDAVLFRGLK